MFENAQKFVRKRKKVDNFIYDRGKKFDNCLYAREKRSTLLKTINTREMLYARKMLISNLDPIKDSTKNAL